MRTDGALVRPDGRSSAAGPQPDPIQPRKRPLPEDSLAMKLTARTRSAVRDDVPSSPLLFPRSLPVPPGRIPPPAPRVSVVIPTFNEAKNLPLVLSRIPADVHQVVVVDGHSVDGTVEVARRLRPDATVVLQNRTGKGNAVACGFAVATGDVVVMLDADGSADPEEIPRFVSALLAGADFAKGTRFAAGGGSSDITPVRAWGNRWLSRLANLLFGTHHTDLCYGYNAFWRHCLDHLGLEPGDPAPRRRWGDGFEIETVIHARMAKAHLRIAEVPSFEHPRIHGESRLNTWRDGGRVLRALAVERIRPAGRRPGRESVPLLRAAPGRTAQAPAGTPGPLWSAHIGRAAGPPGCGPHEDTG
jgi:hypothetical protein